MCVCKRCTKMCFCVSKCMVCTATKNPIYVFLFWELRGLSPNFHIHVSVSDLYIPRIGPHISCSRRGRSIVGIYKSLTDTWMWKLWLWLRHSFSGNICFKFSVLVLCRVVGCSKSCCFCLEYGGERIEYYRGPRSSSIWVTRNLSHHMIKKTRTVAIQC